MSAVDFALVPVVDLRSNPAAAAAALHRAATEVGFFYVIGHDVPNSVIEAAYAASRAFFALPAAVKRSVQIDRRHRGFIEIGEAKMHEAAKPDLKESFIFGLELPESDPDVVAGKPLMGPNQWPERNLPELRPVLTAYYDAVGGLGQRILALMAIALDLPAAFFAERYRKPLARGSIIYYPPQPPDMSDPRYGVSAHTDYGCITLLSQDMNGGLEVRNRAGEWIAAPPRADAFIINIGDLLARWTNDRYASTPHRVVNRSGRARYSIALFYDPDVDTPIETLTSCQAVGASSATRRPPAAPISRNASMRRSPFAAGRLLRQKGLIVRCRRGGGEFDEPFAVGRSGQARIGADAAIGKAPAMLGGIEVGIAAMIAEKRCRERREGRHRRRLHDPRTNSHRHSDLARRCVQTLAIGVEAAAKFIHRRKFPPASQSQPHFLLAGASRRKRRVNIVEGRTHSGDIAAMAVEKIKMLKALPGERTDIVFDQRHKRARPHADGAGKMQVEWRHAESNGRAHQGAGTIAGSGGDGFRAYRIGRDQPVRSMLLDRAYRNHDTG